MTAGEFFYKEQFNKAGYEVLKLPEGETPVPDYQLTKGKQVFAYCEVKDILISCSNAHSAVQEVVKVMKTIQNGAKQLRSYNKEHKIPNILAIFCDRIGMDANDLHDAIFGYVNYRNGDKVYRRYIPGAEDKMREYAGELDIILFYNNKINAFSEIYNTDKFSEEYLKSLNILFGAPMWGNP